MSTEYETTLDLRKTPRAECEQRLKSRLTSLDTGDSMLAIANHDVKRVLNEFEDEQKEGLDWTYEQEGPDKWSLIITKGERTAFDVYDVTEIPPAQRHKNILARFTTMDVGNGFVLVNDHDPKPLFYELRSIHGDTFEWNYQKKEPGEWRVRVKKTGESRNLPEQATTRVDVRRIPPEDRHASIFHRYDLLAPGDAMEIVADHDPQPLRHQLDESQDDSFRWDYLEKEPQFCRVLLTKTDSSDKVDIGNEESGTGDAGDINYPELDVRDHPPAKRHELIFNRYEDLDDDDGFILINDHDPKPLYYQLKEDFPGELRWEYLKQNDGAWKVLIGRA